MTTSMSQDDEDRRLLTLAAEIAESSDREVPTLLLKVRDLFTEEQGSPKTISKLKQDFWKYELLQVLILVLKQNFEYVPGGWKTASELATFASNICTGLDPGETHEYYGLCLPNACENILMLSRRVQMKYSEEKNDVMRKNFLVYFRTSIEAVSMLFSSHVFLTANALRSSWLLQLMITDDPDIAYLTVNLVQYALRINPEVMASLDEKVIFSLLDELVYRLTSCNDKFVARAAIKTLVLLCQMKPYYIEILCNRYKGLRPLMSVWSGKGFGQDLKEFVGILDAGNSRHTEAEKFHRAATVIQAAWKSYKTRRTLKKANFAIAKFQRSFRAIKDRKQKQEMEQKVEAELRHRLLVARKQSMRQTKKKQLQILDMLPAATIQRYLESEMDKAALRIQCAWRGYCVRKRMADFKHRIKRIKATITIQRRVRRFLTARERIRDERLPWQRQAGLTDECRVALQSVILSYREAHPPKARSRREQEDLHNNCQDTLKRHVMMSRVDRRRQMHREALLAELETDSDLLLNAPKLNTLGDNHLSMFRSHSLPVATKAKEEHLKALRLLSEPWWARLRDDLQDSPYDGDYVIF